MKILCVIDSLGSGGAQRQLVNMAVGFKEKGHNVLFLVYHSKNFFKEILGENNISIYEIIEPNYFKRLIKMRHFIRNGRFDSVLSFLEGANLICEITGLPWRKWKLVVGERSANPAILKSIKLRAYRWSHLFADHVVANSFENIKIVRKSNPLLSTKKCHVIYNIVDFEKWKPDENYIPLKDGKFKIVVAASHRYLKNLKNVILGVNLLTDEEKNKLIIEWYGDNIEGDYFDKSYPEALELIEKLKLQNQFRFYPATYELPTIVKKADAVGLFSFYEGLPNAVCEAMFAGKPVIVTNISDVPLLINDEKLICDPESPDSVKNAFSYLLSCNSPKINKIVEENRKKALALFNKEKIINQYIELIK